jgi:hypothetical protein
VTTSPSWYCVSPTKGSTCHFISGAEGIRTPDLHHAKAGPYCRACSPLFKTPAKRPIPSGNVSRLFAVVRVGWCTTGVSGSQRRRRGRGSSAIETWLRASFGEFVRPSRHDEVVLVQTTNLVCPPGDRYLAPLCQQCGVVPLLLGLLAYFVGES